jgi:hypothetical protein
MRIDRKFIRSLPLDHDRTYCNVDKKSYHNVLSICSQVSSIDEKFDYIITRNKAEMSVRIQVKPYGYRKGFQSTSPHEQDSIGEGNGTGAVD